MREAKLRPAITFPAKSGRKDLNAPVQTTERPDQEQGRDRFSNHDATAKRSAAHTKERE
jgi:hypothetical protein